MPTGYGGTYRASVVDNADPMLQNRLLVLVPDVTGSQSAWAMPASIGAPAPALSTAVRATQRSSRAAMSASPTDSLASARDVIGAG